MGIFQKKDKPVDTPEAKAERMKQALEGHEQRMREFAAKQEKTQRSLARTSGFPHEGAEMVLCSGVGSPRCVVIRTGQVEFFTKDGLNIFNSNQQHVVVAMSDITEVDIQKVTDLKATLTISGATGGFAIKTSWGAALNARDLIARLRDSAQLATVDSARMVESPTEALKSLRELHELGLLTSEEFEAKRKALVERL